LINDTCGWTEAAGHRQQYPKLKYFSEMGIESSLLNQQQLESRLGTDHYGLGVYCEGGGLLQPAALVKGLLESLSEQIETYAESPGIWRTGENVFASGCYNFSGVAKSNIMGKLIAEHAIGHTSELVDIARSLAKPNWIPPKCFFRHSLKCA